MPILNRLILVLLLSLASGASCRCGLEILLELTGCNLLVCGHLDELETDDCCSAEAPPAGDSATDCCPDDPADHDEDDCLCCNGDPDLAVMGRDEVSSAASDLVIFDTLFPADWPGAIWMSDVLSARPGTQWGVGPPTPPTPPESLLRQRTLLQI